MKKRMLIGAIFALTAVGITLGFIRIYQVNSVFEKNAAMSMQEKTQSSQVEAGYALGEAIDISRLTMNKRTAADGMSVLFSNSAIMTMEEVYAKFPDWNPFLASDWRKYDKPKYFVVETIFTNAGEVASPILWFKLESGSWSTVIEPNDTKMFNGDNHIEDYTVQPGEEKTVYAVYVLREDTFSKDQWANVDAIPFDVVLLDYPDEISVRVWEGAQ